MKKHFVRFFTLGICVLVFAGCVGVNAAGKNPWAPPEKKKPLAERWDEAAKKKAEETAKESGAVSAGVPAVEPTIVSVAESQEIGEIVFADKTMAVAYRLGGSRVPVKKGEFFALRTKDLVLSGVARLDVIDGETLGFALIAGTSAIGDMVTIPGKTLREEINLKFPACLPPEPASN